MRMTKFLVIPRVLCYFKGNIKSLEAQGKPPPYRPTASCSTRVKSCLFREEDRRLAVWHASFFLELEGHFWSFSATDDFVKEVNESSNDPSSSKSLMSEYVLLKSMTDCFSLSLLQCKKLLEDLHLKSFASERLTDIEVWKPAVKVLVLSSPPLPNLPYFLQPHQQKLLSYDAI